MIFQPGSGGGLSIASGALEGWNQSVSLPFPAKIVFIKEPTETKGQETGVSYTTPGQSSGWVSKDGGRESSTATLSEDGMTITFEKGVSHTVYWTALG